MLLLSLPQRVWQYNAAVVLLYLCSRDARKRWLPRGDDAAVLLESYAYTTAEMRCCAARQPLAVD